MSVRTPSDVYAQQLYPLGYGYPLWDPEPPRPSDEVFVGDVGFVKDGAFCRAFNATKPRDDPVNSEFGVPDGYEPFEYPKYLYVQKAGALVPGARCSKAIKQLSVEVNASNHHVSAGLKFQCTNEQGAVLVLQHSADSQEILPSRKMALYMSENLESWHDFITAVLGVDIHKGSILFVYGVYKTPQWAVASYTEAGKHAQFRFNADLVASSSAFSVSASKESYTAPAQNWGPRSGMASTSSSADAPSMSNQSVFIHYYKWKRRLLVFPAIMKGAAGYDELPPGPDGGTDMGGTSAEVSTPSSVEEVGEIERDYADFQAWDPVDFVLDYILKHETNAEIAVANDRDIASLCDKLGCEIPDNIEEFLEAVKPHVEVTAGGVGMLTSSQEDLAGRAPAPLAQPSTVHESASPPIAKDSTGASVQVSGNNILGLVTSPASHDSTYDEAGGRSDVGGDTAGEKAVQRYSDHQSPNVLISGEVKNGDHYKDKQTNETDSVTESWWKTREVEARPWLGEGKRQTSVPKEQEEGWLRTRKRVAEAVSGIVGVAEATGHESLAASSDSLEFAPLQGLRGAALTLLNIWEALQNFEMNRMAYLRLTERCAMILSSVHKEVADAGDQAGEELFYPIQRLVSSVTQVHRLLQEDSNRPFIKRYLKRTEIQRQIAACDDALNDALGMFSLSIQTRTLRQMLQTEQQQPVDAATPWVELHEGHEQASAFPDAITNKLQLAEAEDPQVVDVTPIAYVDQLMRAPSDQIRETLSAITLRQNEHDLAQDTADLRQLVQSMLQENSDVELLHTFQDGHNEIPKAIEALQHALEDETAHENAVAGQEDTVFATSVGSTAETRLGAGSGEDANLGRSASAERMKMVSDQSSSHKCPPKDTLDREFIKTGIDALRRLSTVEESLQSWAITRYEVDEEQKIGTSSFSDVYKGTWRTRTVAIKVLAEVTPRQLFIHEVNIWKSLSHPNVLELLGASSASSKPPLFFISPYMKNGSLISYLKGLPSLDSVNPLKIIHEIALGMAYLHSKGILHGDLKGTNVLLDDQWHCVISDYGQSEIKSEVYRLSGTPAPHGALRWQAPELMAGEVNITQQTDVYAFAMCSIEVLTKGGLPWPLADEDTVRRLVLKEDMRPEIPIVNQQWTPRLAEMMQTCWVTEADRRPSFAKVVEDIQRIRQNVGDGVKNPPSHDLPSDALPEQVDEYYDSRDERRYRQLLQHEFHPSLSLPLWTPTPVPLGSIGYLAKPQGKFVTLFNAFKPLESSGGRMSNVDPIESFGRVTRGMQKSDKRSVVQRGTDMIQSWVPLRSDQPPTTASRRYSSRLRVGQKSAYLFTESTTYRYMDDLGAPKRWFKANIDAILKEYEVEHNIGREDVILVIGTLEARDYALYVSHGHLDGELNFNVYSSSRAGQPWGYFSVTNDLSSRVEAYVHDDPEGRQWAASAEKVSTVRRGGKWDAVLLARLRFTTDSAEPTSK